VAWQRRIGLVAQGPFRRRLVPEAELPPRLEWRLRRLPAAAPDGADRVPLPAAERSHKNVELAVHELLQYLGESRG
jgi:hypothetical protein